MGRLGEEAKRIIQEEMAGLSGSAARAKAKMLAEQFKCDITRIYYYSRDVRKRRERKDKGKPRSVNEDSLRTMFYFTVNADFSGNHVTEIAEANGIAHISPSTYNRILRQRRISRRDLKRNLRPFRRWEARKPNEIHQIDTTVAQQFYLDDDGSIGYEPVSRRNKNKPGNKKPRLVLFQLVDDYSRVKWATFMLGNHTIAWMNALYEAWRTKRNASLFPFCGIPDAIYSDNDSVIKSAKFRKAMEILGVEIKTHEVDNPQAKGKVESGFRLLQEFEKITKLRKFQSLEEANYYLMDFLLKYNNRKHSTTGEVPFARWLEIEPERLRDVPDEQLFRLLHMDHTTRLIYPDLHLELNGKHFQLPRRKPFINYIGERVQVFWYPYDDHKIYVVLDNKDYEVEYAAPDVHAAGEYRKVEEPEWLKLRRKIEEMDTPEVQIAGFYKDKYGKQWLPKQAQAFDEAEMAKQMPTEGTMRSRLWFINRLQEEFFIETPPTAEEKAFVDMVFDGKDEMPERELEDTIRRIRSGELVIHQQRGFGVA